MSLEKTEWILSKPLLANAFNQKNKLIIHMDFKNQSIYNVYMTIKKLFILYIYIDIKKKKSFKISIPEKNARI